MKCFSKSVSQLLKERLHRAVLTMKDRLDIAVLVIRDRLNRAVLVIIKLKIGYKEQH